MATQPVSHADPHSTLEVAANMPQEDYFRFLFEGNAHPLQDFSTERIQKALTIQLRRYHNHNSEDSCLGAIGAEEKLPLLQRHLKKRENHYCGSTSKSTIVKLCTNANVWSIRLKGRFIALCMQHDQVQLGPFDQNRSGSKSYFIVLYDIVSLLAYKFSPRPDDKCHSPLRLALSNTMLIFSTDRLIYSCAFEDLPAGKVTETITINTSHNIVKTQEGCVAGCMTAVNHFAAGFGNTGTIRIYNTAFRSEQTIGCRDGDSPAVLQLAGPEGDISLYHIVVKTQTEGHDSSSPLRLHIRQMSLSGTLKDEAVWAIPCCTSTENYAGMVQTVCHGASDRTEDGTLIDVGSLTVSNLDIAPSGEQDTWDIGIHCHDPDNVFKSVDFAACDMSSAEPDEREPHFTLHVIVRMNEDGMVAIRTEIVAALSQIWRDKVYQRDSHTSVDCSAIERGSGHPDSRRHVGRIHSYDSDLLSPFDSVDTDICPDDHTIHINDTCLVFQSAGGELNHIAICWFDDDAGHPGCRAIEFEDTQDGERIADTATA